MESLEFILVANSPGELSSLVKPVVEKIKSVSSKLQPIRTTLVITPCQFSSGREIQFAKSLGVDNIITSEEYRKWILGIPLKRELKFKYKGVVLYLGGDLMHPILIAKKLGYRPYAYLHGQKAGWKNLFKKFFVIDQKAKKELRHARIPGEKITIAGDLMINSVSADPKHEVIKTWKLNTERPIIAFLPGSREWEIDYMLPFYTEVAGEIKKIIPGSQFLLIISPFSSMQDIESKMVDNLFDVMAPLNVISAADLAVTIPGTNTAHIATLGIPTLMLFPLNKLDDIPLEGLLHYITKIPFLGKPIKRAAANIINRKTKFFALPNIRAQKMIIPEMRGNLTTEEVVAKILDLINHPEKTNQIGIKLKKIMGESNAAEIIIGEILSESLYTAG
ncbi:MAG: hypothetical protein HQ564_05775 [Candidatus Saganbacteria bacterium]|nr:hypothetical protein [Candidatus Saganbacteria bacterium]